MVTNGFESPGRVVRCMQFLFMLLFNDVAQLIVCDNLVKLAVGHFHEEFDGLVIGCIIVDDLSCNGSTEFSTVIHVTDECEPNKFIRAEVW